ncbi:MAG: DinB family protein [Planctomycetes bacterium]|nr:DinB family protein [Planctomycetota bacterium]
MDRQTLVALWLEAEKSGLWHVAWSKAAAGLTAAQAAWKPQPGRHSIWQIVNHMIYWREHELRTLAGKKPDDAETSRRNFEEPRETNESVWTATVARFGESHAQVAAALGDERNSLDRLRNLLAHDSYHVGQVMYVRSLQGLPPVD